MQITPDLHGNTVLHCLQEANLDTSSNGMDQCYYLSPDEAI